MASDNSPARTEGLEHQDVSIKARKVQLFEAQDRGDEVAYVLKPFKEYVRSTPAAPISAGVKASLWATAVVVVLLFIAALMLGGSGRSKRRHAAAPRPRPAALSIVG